MRRSTMVSALRSLLLVVAVLASAGSTAAAARGEGRKAAPAAPTTVGGKALTDERSDYLPNDAILARVGERKVDVYTFRERYFASDINYRPSQDSLGRVSFLRSMVDKDVLGQVALQAGYSFGFEDRAELRAFRNQIISNRLFERTVNAKSQIPADSVEKVAGWFGRQIRLRLLSFPDRTTAEFTRLKLVSGQMAWRVALSRYAAEGDSLVDGMSRWMNFSALPLDVALRIWPLRIGESSSIIATGPGYFLAQVADERYPAGRTVTTVNREFARRTLRATERAVNKARIYGEAKQGLEIAYDTTAVSWTASHFKAVRRSSSGDGFGLSMDVDPTVPEFSPADTGRVLVTWKGGRLTLGTALHEWTDLQPILRPSINTFESLCEFIDSIVLEPRLIEIAEQRGMDQDSVVVALMNRKREELLVTHMAQDSVLNSISVTKPERRAYYDEHRTGFISWATVRFAQFPRRSKAAADSVLARLRAGVPATQIVAEDHVAGIAASDTGTIAENEPSPYKHVIFEELHPGQSTVAGPYRGVWYTLTVLAHDPGTLLPFEVMEGVIDESVRNQKGERALNAWIARLSKRFVIESHPELVMRVRLTDPTNETIFD